MLRECLNAVNAIVTTAQIEVMRKVELAKFQLLVATEPTEAYYVSNLFTEYDDCWELLESLGQQNMPNNEKRLWLLGHMFLKEKNEKWAAMFLMLGTQTNATYKETTDAIQAYQTKIDLAEANANNANVTVCAV